MFGKSNDLRQLSGIFNNFDNVPLLYWRKLTNFSVISVTLSKRRNKKSTIVFARHRDRTTFCNIELGRAKLGNAPGIRENPLLPSSTPGYTHAAEKSSKMQQM